MPLSDMADLHVSQPPEGGRDFANSDVLKQPVWDSEANLAQSSAGEAALQRRTQSLQEPCRDKGTGGMMEIFTRQTRLHCATLLLATTSPPFFSSFFLVLNASCRLSLRCFELLTAPNAAQKCYFLTTPTKKSPKIWKIFLSYGLDQKCPNFCPQLSSLKFWRATKFVFQLILNCVILNKLNMQYLNEVNISVIFMLI